jgi:hypothetical protein
MKPGTPFIRIDAAGARSLRPARTARLVGFFVVALVLGAVALAGSAVASAVAFTSSHGDAVTPATGSAQTSVAPPLEPGFAIEILQRLDHAGAPFTHGQLTGDVGQTIDYEILVKNTGNAAMTFATFSDSACDAGSVSGGPSAGALPPGEVTSYYCTHLLSAADQKAGIFPNSVTLAGSAGEVSSVTSELSNTVVVSVAPAPSSPPPSSPLPAAPDPNPPAQPEIGIANAAWASWRASGAAAHAAAAAAPALTGPSGCVRASFAAGVASAGVRSVAFSLDGRRLKTLAAARAHTRTLSVTVDVSRLAMGRHRLLAAITMQGAASPTAAARATRTLTFRRCGSAL